jgi:hypothetical protein
MVRKKVRRKVRRKDGTNELEGRKQKEGRKEEITECTSCYVT